MNKEIALLYFEAVKKEAELDNKVVIKSEHENDDTLTITSEYSGSLYTLINIEVYTKKKYLSNDYDVPNFVDGKLIYKPGKPRIKWEEVAKDYDAVRSTWKAGLYRGEEVKLPNGCTTNIDSWDAESTCWFKPKFREVSREEF